MYISFVNLKFIPSTIIPYSRTALTSLLMLGGYSSMTGCISGSLLGCKFGYSQLPKHWIEGLNPKNREWLNCKINGLLDMMGLP